MSQQKVVALTELTSSAYIGQNPLALNYIKTFNYYWTLYPNFITFEIIDNKSDGEYTVSKLEEYYQKGYKLFFGPLSSSLVLYAYNNWFKYKKDVIGITPLAKTTQLSIPKNIYRLDPGNYNFLGYIYDKMPSQTSRIFYIYTEGQIGTTDLLEMIQTSPYEIIKYPILQDSSNVTTTLLNEFFYVNNTITSNDIVMLFFIGGQGQPKYVSLFSDILFQNIPIQYDVSDKFPLINSQNPPIYLYNKYNTIISQSINTTSLLVNAKLELGTSYASNSVTSIYLLTLLANNENIDNAYSYGEVVPWFNENNDLKYWSYSIYVYTETGFQKTNIYLNDPVYGTITFNKKV